LLDEKVAERTKELEISKKAAEAANESKTLFIANISHELKTPLNGIMGMCAVCMEEDDIVRIKQSLKTLYKSGKSLCNAVRYGPFANPLQVTFFFTFWRIFLAFPRTKSDNR
jgi:signal transduction histidine kinase